MILFSHSLQDAKHRNIENILILAGDHLYRMDYMDFLQVLSQLSLCYSYDPLHSLFMYFQVSLFAGPPKFRCWYIGFLRPYGWKVTILNL